MSERDWVAVVLILGMVIFGVLTYRFLNKGGSNRVLKN